MMKFNKISAALLASAMTLTASPVFAAYSPDASDKPVNSVVLSPKDKLTGVNIYEIGDEIYTVETADRYASAKEKMALASITTDTGASRTRKEIIEDAGYKMYEDTKTIVLGSGFYELINITDSTVVNKLPGNANFTVGFQLEGEAKAEFAGKDIFVMHFNETDDSWEVCTARVGKDGGVKVTLNSLSPISFVGSLKEFGDTYDPIPIIPGFPNKPSLPAIPGFTNHVSFEPAKNTFGIKNEYVLTYEKDENITQEEYNALASVVGEDAKEERDKILKQHGVTEDELTTTLVLGGGFYALMDKENETIVHQLPDGEPFTAKFLLEETKYRNQDILVMHYVTQGEKNFWDVIRVHVNKDGNFEVKLDSLSPLAFIGTWCNRPDNKPGNNNSSNNGNSNGSNNGNSDKNDGAGNKDKNPAGGAADNGANGGAATGVNALSSKVSPNTAA